MVWAAACPLRPRRGVGGSSSARQNPTPVKLLGRRRWSNPGGRGQKRSKVKTLRITRKCRLWISACGPSPVSRAAAIAARCAARRATWRRARGGVRKKGVPCRGAHHRHSSVPCPPLPSRTNWTSLVPPLVLTGQASSLPSYTRHSSVPCPAAHQTLSRPGCNTPATPPPPGASRAPSPQYAQAPAPRRVRDSRAHPRAHLLIKIRSSHVKSNQVKSNQARTAFSCCCADGAASAPGASCRAAATSAPSCSAYSSR